MRAHNSTIQLKKKPCKLCGIPSLIFSKGRCQNCARIEDALARDEKETEKVIKEEDLSGLIQDADTIFSQYIRLKYADAWGMVKCYTCDIFRHWTLMQCGHFAKRGNLLLRYDERNCRPQETICNEINYGEPAKFLRKLNEEENGMGDILLEEAKLVYKPTRQEIMQIISEYTPRVKEMKLKKSVPK